MRGLGFRVEVGVLQSAELHARGKIVKTTHKDVRITHAFTRFFRLFSRHFAVIHVTRALE